MTRTPNYDLTQFNGSDTPSWLVDYNGDMGKIDTALGNIANDSTAALGQAEAANSAAVNAGNTASTAATNASQALATANSALNTAAQHTILIQQNQAAIQTNKNDIDALETRMSTLNFVKITQTQYDALVTKDSNTVYFVIAG